MYLSFTRQLLWHAPHSCLCVARAVQVRAWDWGKPLLVAPAMNTHMWDSPFTAQQLAVLSGLGAHIVPPVRAALSQSFRICD